MAIQIKHKFTSAKVDGTDSTLIQPSNWNDTHDLTLAAGKVLGRDASGAGAVQELAIAVDATQQSMIPPSGNTASRPATPVAGMMRYNTTTTKFEGYTSAWGTLGGGCTISSSAPSAPQPGDLWWDQDDGQLYVYYDDGTSTQWVIANYFTGAGAFLPTTGGTLSGNLGVGSALSAWGGTSSAIELSNGAIDSRPGVVSLWQNGYFDGTNSRYKTTAAASGYYMGSGQHVWLYAPSGTAGNVITFSEGMRIEANGNLKCSAGITIGDNLGIVPTSNTTGLNVFGQSGGYPNGGGIVYRGNTSAGGVAQNGLEFYASSAERARLDTNGNFLMTSSGALGYGTGSGGTVTQLTSKSTGVTLNKTNGQITMNSQALGASGIVAFTLTNSVIASTDVISICITGGGTGAAYTINAAAQAGSAAINVRNNTGGSLSEALVLQFVVIKSVTA